MRLVGDESIRLQRCLVSGRNHEDRYAVFCPSQRNPIQPALLVERTGRSLESVFQLEKELLGEHQDDVLELQTFYTDSLTHLHPLDAAKLLQACLPSGRQSFE